MNEKLLIEIIKIIKQSKQPIVRALSTDFNQKSFVDFDTVMEDIQKHTKKLANSITKEAKTFNREYDSEEQMIKAVKDSFKEIESVLRDLVAIYKDIKSEAVDNNIQALLALQISSKILNDYILWCEKLENALLGSGDDEAVFIPNIEYESKIISFIVDNTNSNELSCWWPFFGGIGLGFLLDE
jgi:hypothetical protein